MLRSLLLLSVTLLVPVQQQSWTTAFPPHTIAGNLHYVGTEDLACFLITTPDGHILVNTGLAGSAPLIRESVEALGYDLADTRILLTMQAHFDHVGALAEIQRLTDAEVLITEPDAPVVEDGGRSDPFMPEAGRFEPVAVDRTLRDGETIRLGGTELVVHLTPGHSKGSATYTMRVTEDGRTYLVALANMGTVVMPLVGNDWYPEIADDFARSFRVQKALTPDIWVAAHASQYGMREKLASGSFVDPDGYREAIARHEQQYLEQLARERRHAAGR